MPSLLTPLSRKSLWLALSAVGVAAGSTQLHASDTDLSALAGLSGVQTQNATALLIRRMAAKGLISKDEAAEMLLAAEADAAEMRAQSAFAQAALAQAAAAEARNRALQAQIARLNGSPVALEDAPIQRRASASRSVNERLAALENEEEPILPPIRTTQARNTPRREVAPADDASVGDPEIDSLVPNTRRAVQAEEPIIRSRPQSTPAKRTVAPAPLPEPEPLPEPVVEHAETESASEEPPPLATAATREIEQQSPLPPVNSQPAPAAEPGVVRVRYIPDSLRRQIKEEVKQEVMAQAREEGWAAPRTFPEWTDRLSFFADFRTRFESLIFPKGNATGSGSPFFNFNAINSSTTPYDIAGVANPPYINTHESRQRARLRLRFGMNADLSDGFTGGLRLATGENNSPVSQNQTFGGSGGGFSKYAIWLDRAFLRYDIGGLPDSNLQFNAGRFENPFFSTTMLWADDLNVDGLSAKGIQSVGEVITPFFNGGIFPVFNTDLNFGTTDFVKTKSRDKWLAALQVGTEVEVSNDVNFKVGAAYYYFKNVEGKVSSRVKLLTASDVADTDSSRPAFAQKGNTYIALRDIIADADNNQGTTNQWQYFGLATPYHIGAATAQLDFNYFQPVQISVFGEYAKNLALDAAKVDANGPGGQGAVNNNGTFTLADNSTVNRYAGSGTGWTFGVRFGHPEFQKRWNWNASLAYRDVGSDATVDGFADSDFGGGGTNQKGFIVSGSVALSKRVWITTKWMSATQKAGPSPIKSDTLQIDLNGKF